MFRFGKHPPRQDYRTLRLKNYLSGTLASPPPSFDVLPRVYQNLDIADPTALFPMDGNDKYGDCTIAALAHAVTVYRGLTKKKKIISEALVEKTYFRLSGGIDSGLNELDVLSYWRSHGVSGDKILGYAKLEPKNHDNVKQAIRLFGGVYLGFQVQENCQQEFHDRTPWTPGRLTRDGHAVFAVAYDSDGLTVLTWGNTQKATWGWWDECVDEAYAVLPAEAKASDFDPGFSFAELQADLAALTG